jgi:DNA-binding NtrC family response regulator
VSIRAFADAGRTSESPQSLETLVERVAQTACDEHGSVVGGQPWQTAVQRLEQALIRQALRRCDNVKLKAADFLGINRNTLNKKFNELGLSKEAPSEEGDKGPPGEADKAPWQDTPE